MSKVDYQIQKDGFLFPKVLWNRPVNLKTAGRLGIIGGHKDQFNSLYSLYEAANASGAGECKLLVPDSLRKFLLGADEAVFFPSSPSGSLGKGALGELAHACEELDCLAIGANVSNNSETAILIEHLLQQLSSKRVVLFEDSLKAVKHNPHIFSDNPNILVIVSMTELFKLAGTLGVPLKINDNSIENKVEIVQAIAGNMRASLAVVDVNIIIAANSQTSVTQEFNLTEQSKLAAYGVLSVFWMQHATGQSLEWLTTAAWIIKKASELPEPQSSSQIARTVQNLLINAS